jgi:hypothetical protein
MTRLMRHRSPGRLLIAAALLLLGRADARAHGGREQEGPGAPDVAANLRTWTHAGGRFEVHGTFVATHGNQVQIRKEDGELLDIKREALSPPDRAWVEARLSTIRRVNSGTHFPLVAQGPPARPPGGAGESEPEMASAFRAFADVLKVRWDRDYFHVESSDIPDHPMMIGITAWQQQVPLPQPYTGANAWRIPLHPVVAKNPLSAESHFFRGAIALAVNGIPIFNPIKNDGRTDTYLAGELDEWGGHCGRADDYHYHMAPVHLEPRIGKGKPLGYALDGYAIYGYDEPDGSKARPLDTFNGHDDAQRGYHYHATRTYPYINGGFHGAVTERDGQVDPQPNAQPLRPALPPLRGARITGFASPKPGSYSLTHEIRGARYFVNYTLAAGGGATFEFVDSTGKTTTETYQRRERGPGEGPRPPRGDRPGPKEKRKQ